MDADAKARKDSDTRASRVKNLVQDLMRMGVTPSAVELDGLRVELRPPTELTQTATGQVVPVSVTESQGPTDVPFDGRGYRQRAKDELRQRIAAGGNS